MRSSTVRAVKWGTPLLLLIPLLSLSGEKEILVADGGSEDATVQIAQSLGVRVVQTQQGEAYTKFAGQFIYVLAGPNGAGKTSLRR